MYFPFPISELTHGWWSISDVPSIEKLVRSFCLRGFREKTLFKSIQKTKDTFSRIFDPSNLRDCGGEFQDLLSSLSIDSRSVTGEEARKMSGEESESEANPRSEVAGDKMEEGSGGGQESPSVEDMQVDPSEPKATPTEETEGGGTEDENGNEKEDKSDSDESTDSDSSSSSSSSNSQTSSDRTVSKPRLSTTSSRGTSSNLIGRSKLEVSLRNVHLVPHVGVFDPVFAELVEQFAVKVLEYVESMEDRLFVAQLHEEVCMYVCARLYTYVQHTHVWPNVMQNYV